MPSLSDCGGLDVTPCFEETGVRASFECVLAMRTQHGAAFGRDDFYMVSAMTPLPHAMTTHVPYLDVLPGATAQAYQYLLREAVPNPRKLKMQMLAAAREMRERLTGGEPEASAPGLRRPAHTSTWLRVNQSIHQAPHLLASWIAL